MPTRKVAFPVFLALVLGVSAPSWAQRVDCYGSLAAYRLSNPELNCTCSSATSMPSCSSGKSSSQSRSGGYTSPKTMMRQSLVTGVFGALFDNVLSSSSGPSLGEIERKNEEARQLAYQKELALELDRQKSFAEKKSQLLGSLKGASTGSLALKTNFDAAKESSKAADLVAAQEQEEFENNNADWIARQRKYIEQRLIEPNKYAAGVYKTIKTNAPPLPYKTFDELQSGDVLLMGGKLIASADNAFSSGSSSSAAHTVLYLREINGKKYFLDNQPFEGPRIISEDDFLKIYKSRDAQLAKLAQPLNAKESEKMFSAAVEMAQKNRKAIVNGWFGSPLVETNYGVWGKDNIVCSEADWALINAAGRKIPKSGDKTKVKWGIDYSPADFSKSQFFLVTNFVMPD